MVFGWHSCNSILMSCSLQLAMFSVTQGGKQAGLSGLGSPHWVRGSGQTSSVSALCEAAACTHRSHYHHKCTSVRQHTNTLHTQPRTGRAAATSRLSHGRRCPANSQCNSLPAKNHCKASHTLCFGWHASHLFKHCGRCVLTAVAPHHLLLPKSPLEQGTAARAEYSDSDKTVSCS